MTSVVDSSESELQFLKSERLRGLFIAFEEDRTVRSVEPLRSEEDFWQRID